MRTTFTIAKALEIQRNDSTSIEFSSFWNLYSLFGRIFFQKPTGNRGTSFFTPNIRWKKIEKI